MQVLSLFFSRTFVSRPLYKRPSKIVVCKQVSQKISQRNNACNLVRNMNLAVGAILQLSHPRSGPSADK